VRDKAYSEHTLERHLLDLKEFVDVGSKNLKHLFRTVAS